MFQFLFGQPQVIKISKGSLASEGRSSVAVSPETRANVMLMAKVSGVYSRDIADRLLAEAFKKWISGDIVVRRSLKDRFKQWLAKGY